MKPRSYSDEGIVLARRNYGEADRILVVYCRGYGKISLLAKAIRQPESRKRGHLEIFSHIRFQAVTGRGPDLITETEIISSFEEIRQSLQRVSLAYYLCEVVGKITREGESHPEVFNLLRSSLEELETAKKLRRFRLNFIFKLLTVLGYWPLDQILINPDEKLAEIVERQIVSVRVGKRMLQ